MGATAGDAAIQDLQLDDILHPLRQSSGGKGCQRYNRHGERGAQPTAPSRSHSRNDPARCG